MRPPPRHQSVLSARRAPMFLREFVVHEETQGHMQKESSLVQPGALFVHVLIGEIVVHSILATQSSEMSQHGDGEWHDTSTSIIFVSSPGSGFERESAVALDVAVSRSLLSFSSIETTR